MVNIIKQTVFQVGDETPNRMIVQFIDGNGEDSQTINNFDDLTDEQKKVFNDFKTLSETLMG